MKKYKLRNITAICILMVIACLSSFATVSAVGYDDYDPSRNGSISVKVDSDAKDIEMTLFDVADMNNGEYVLNSSFEKSGENLTDLSNAEKVKKVAKNLEKYASDNAIQGIASKIGDDGIANFADVKSTKLYLAVQSSESEEFEIQPLLVAVPYNSDGKWIYDISVEAKFTKNPKQIGAVILNKTNMENKVLEGAVFAFQSKTYYTDASKVPANAEKGKDSNGTYYWSTVSAELKTDKNGQIAVENLKYGTYRFIEVKAPANYKLNSTPNVFDIKEYGTIKVENDFYVADEGNPVILNVKNEPVPVESSVPESSIPESSTSQPSNPVITGDNMNKYIFIGVAVAASLAVIIVIFVVAGKKKKK